MTHSITVAIAPQLEDNFLSAVAEFQEEVEQQVNTIAPDPTLDYIHAAHRDFATTTARQLNHNQIERLQIELSQGRELVEAKQRLTRRGEFSKFKRSLSMTLSDARKYTRLALTFGDWQIDRILLIASATNIYRLCQPKFAGLVEKLKQLPALTSDAIKQMVKDSHPPRKPKPQQQSTVEWQQDASGGGRHLSINLYDDELAVKINRDAEERQITAQEAIADAFRKSRCASLSDVPSESQAQRLTEQAQRERREAVDEVRARQIQMQREINQKDECIDKMRQQIVQKDQLITQKDNHINELELKLSVEKLQPPTEKQPRISLEDFDNWEEFAISLNCDAEGGYGSDHRDRLMEVVRSRSASERQHLSSILSGFLEREPQGLDTVNWLPEKLISAACRYLSFNVERISGEENLVDEPTIETIFGCKFVSVRDFGTKRECWVFQLPDKKNVPIFGREQFQIERL